MLEQDFGKGMAMLLEAFRADLSEVAMEAYWVALQDLGASDWSQAVMRALKEAKHMPRASELRDFAQAISSDDRAIAAWHEVRGAIARHGIYQSVSFEDLVINATIRGMGGWQRVCMMPAEEFAVWGRKEFERQYVAFSRRGVDQMGELAAPLIGVAEQTNKMSGLAAPETRRIQSTTPTIARAGERRLEQIEAAGEMMKKEDVT